MSFLLRLHPKDRALRLVAGQLALEKLEIQTAETPSELLENQTAVQGVHAIALQLAENADAQLVGTDAEESALLLQWITASGRCAPAETKTFLASFNTFMTNKTFIVGERITVGDWIVFADIYDAVRGLAQQKVAFPALVRWFDQVQHMVTARALEQAGLQLVAFKLGVFGAASAPEADPKVDKQKAPKEPKEPRMKKEKTPEAPKEAAVAVPSQIDLRVGRVVQVDKHPNADSLYVEQIDVGEEKPREVVSGLVNHIPIEEMLDRHLVVVCNLKPATMRGVKSFGMVLAATCPLTGKVELVDPPAGAVPGQRVYAEGFRDGAPEEVLNPKKKIWEAIQPGLRTNDALQAAYIDPEGVAHLLLTDQGACTVPTVANASIK